MTKNNDLFPISKLMLDKALTHSSFAKQNNVDSNELLEFLGDAALQLIISEELMARFPSLNEGDLSRIRANIVSEKSLVKVAKIWDIEDKIKVVQSSNKKLPSILSDAVEAIIGAIYIEKGFFEVKEFVLNEFEILLKDAKSITESEDYKTKLQELLQDNGGVTPKYVVVDEKLIGNEKEFVIAVVFNEVTLASASAKNKKQAGQNAAKLALKKIEEDKDFINK